MTKTTLNAGELRRVLIYVAEEIRKEEAALNALDSAVGDGDHGITMRLGFDAVKAMLEREDETATISSIFASTGQAFISSTGGAIGVIMGKMFLSSAAALRGVFDFGAPELKMSLVAMETAVGAVGKAKPGDKTILDAILRSIWQKPTGLVCTVLPDH